MPPFSPEFFGANLSHARVSAGLTQQGLATRSGVNRVSIAKIELGQSIAGIDDVVRLAGALSVPIQKLITGTYRPPSDLAGIAAELHALGVRDLVVSSPIVPGAFRRREEVLVLALRGDRPEVRVIEALPYVLARHPWNVGLVRAFARTYDPRVQVRLAWLSEVTQILGGRGNFTIKSEAVLSLGRLTRLVRKPKNPDDLGHPGTGPAPPVWKRWNITYGGGIAEFRSRAADLATANTKGGE